MPRTFLSGASLVLPDRIEAGSTLVIEGGRIADILTGPRDVATGEVRVHVPGGVVVPGFIDVHVHGVLGRDVMDGPDAIAEVAAMLPRFGVTAFCPTSIACAPDVLSSFLAAVSALRAGGGRGARVLPAHLESNFISPRYNGAQPVSCLRNPRAALAGGQGRAGEFSGADILGAIDDHRADVGIVTLASELEGGLNLVRRFAQAGVRVSLGHSGATLEEAQEAIAAGARHATHLFNRMPPMTHREPGLAGAILASEEIAAEIIGDGHHVHPAFIRLAIAAKGRSKIMAITDGTAGSGMPRGSRAALGGRPITVDDVARLDDGTIAGSVATMDRVFACLVGACGLNPREAAEVCATTPARELGLIGHGVIAQGAVADLVVLSSRLGVEQTWIAGELAWSGTSSPRPPSPSS